VFIRAVARAALASLVHRLNTVKVGHRITDSRFAAWVCGDGVAIARLRYGAQAIVFANEYNGRAMYLWGEHDPRISDVIIALLRKGDTVLDIGANFGVTGLLAAKCVGPTGTVHLFEPQPLVASCLRASLLINGYSNAVVHECALSNHNGSASMTILDAGNMGMTTLSPSVADSTPPERAINVRAEDAGEYVASLGCDKVALIKIDVEGHEPVIFASMREWLVEKRPPIILFECHLYGQTFEEHKSVQILSELGYGFFSIDVRPYWHTHLFAVTNTRRPIGYDFVAVLWQELYEDRRCALEAMMVRRDR
jgi:FkbM family methyltransferase